MHKIFILYDSILNSVFSSMVLAPILQELEKDSNLVVWLISFENKKINSEKLKLIIPTHDRLNLILAERFRFIGKLSLKTTIAQLKRILKQIPYDSITCRGALAGYIALKSTNNKITVQSRGLTAEEYKYVKNTKHFLYKWMYKQLKQIENHVYSSKNVFIHAVSPALKNYLVENFHANPTKITLEDSDIPKKILPAKKLTYQNLIRQKLSIKKDSVIYCYSGSAKPWQCAEETINYFEKNLSKETKNFLLILSQDKGRFKKLINKSKISNKNYAVINAQPNEIEQYLSACNYGMLFRKKSPVNWVSRPCKMLEYQNAGLKIIHNNTIAYLANDQVS